MTGNKPSHRADAIAGAVLTLAGLITLIFVIPSQIKTGGEYGLSSSFVPNLFMGVLTALSALLTVKGIFGQRHLEVGTGMNSATWRHLGLVVVVLAVTLGLMALAGYFVGGVFVIAAFMFYQGARRPLTIAVTALGGAGLIYLFFRHGLGIVLT